MLKLHYVLGSLEELLKIPVPRLYTINSDSLEDRPGIGFDNFSGDSSLYPGVRTTGLEGPCNRIMIRRLLECPDQEINL